ncbi:MAG: NfeD family protein [Spirochaetaceae bacterium]|nr:NfeD family protein [Spirochaetaceae bacterium]
MDILLPVQPAWLWLAVALILAVIELLTAFALTTIWFAIPAVLLIFVSSVVVPFRWQAAIFLVLSLALLIFARPFAVKKLRVGKEKTNIDGLIGKTAVVIKTIHEFEKGEIKLNGLVWSAGSEDGSVIEAGCVCIVKRIEGTRAIVYEQKDTAQNPETKNLSN